MSYLPCELHCHTVHSDGDFTVRQLEDSAVNDHLAVVMNLTTALFRR